MAVALNVLNPSGDFAHVMRSDLGILKIRVIRRKGDMFKYGALVTAVTAIALAVPGKPVVQSGSWQVDARHSDAQLSTDGTTNFGKAKRIFTVGFARVGGIVKLDAANPADSSIHIDFYPSTSMDPTIDHDGKVSIEWFANNANNTMVCFHSQGTQQIADGRLSTKGTLGLIRVDRNVELTASEAYSGPVYGPPIIHHVSQPATLVFDVPAVATKGPNKGSLETSGSSSMAREDFPQLFRAVFATQWPPVVRDENCQTPNASEAYAGSLCTGTFLVPSFPLGPNATASEDYPGPQNFNTIVGQQLSIAVHMRLKPQSSGAQAGAGN
jgi:polyisoprenoid-binding protein YceI